MFDKSFEVPAISLYVSFNLQKLLNNNESVVIPFLCTIGVYKITSCKDFHLIIFFSGVYIT